MTVCHQGHPERLVAVHSGTLCSYRLCRAEGVGVEHSTGCRNWGTVLPVVTFQKKISLFERKNKWGRGVEREADSTERRA